MKTQPTKTQPTKTQPTKTQPTYDVWVEFPLIPNWDQIDSQIFEVVGYSHGSGAGSGLRDHSWHGLSKTEALHMVNQIKDLKIKDVTCSLRMSPS